MLMNAPTRTAVCGGSLNPAKPCRGDAVVTQTHRHKVTPLYPGSTAHIDVVVPLCTNHARRLTVGTKVRGVQIVSEQPL